jgi:hypothetical protein
MTNQKNVLSVGLVAATLALVLPFLQAGSEPVVSVPTAVRK